MASASVIGGIVTANLSSAFFRTTVGLLLASALLALALPKILDIELDAAEFNRIASVQFVVLL